MSHNKQRHKFRETIIPEIIINSEIIVALSSNTNEGIMTYCKLLSNVRPGFTLDQNHCLLEMNNYVKEKPVYVRRRISKFK